MIRQAINGRFLFRLLTAGLLLLLFGGGSRGHAAETGEELARRACEAMRDAGLDPAAEVKTRNVSRAELSSAATKAVRKAGLDVTAVRAALKRWPETLSESGGDGGDGDGGSDEVLIASPESAATSEPAAPRFVVPDDHPTIQAAVDAAGPGDVIAVRPGRYQESVRVRNRQTGLTIRAADPANPPEILGTPNASRDGIRVDKVDGIKLRNLRILGAYDGVRLNNVRNARLEDLYIENSALSIRVNGGSSNTIRRCRLKGTRVEQAITIDGSPKTVVSDTTISGSYREGLRALNSPGLALSRVTATGSRGSGGIMIGKSAGARVENCSASGNYGDGIRVTGSAELTFTGNTATGNRGIGLRIEKCPPYATEADVTEAGNTADGNRRGEILVRP